MTEAEMTPMPPDAPRVVVIIPTYNERENLQLILERVFAAVPHAHSLIVDDNSEYRYLI